MLKALRKTLEAPQLVKKCVRVALVAPQQYREPHIASEKEGYFAEVDGARAWLKAGTAP